MKLNYKTLIIAALILGLGGYAIGRYAQPAKVEIQTKEVIKEVEVTKKDTHTEIKEVVRPDGTKETTTVITDKSTSTSDKSSKKESDTTIVSAKPQWRVAGGLVPATNIKDALYMLSAERRIIGPVFAGVWANTDKKIGASVSVEF